MAVWFVEKWSEASLRQRCAMGAIPLLVLLLGWLLLPGNDDAANPALAEVVSHERGKESQKLAQLARHADARVAAEAVVASARLEGSRAMPVIEYAVKDARPEVRAAGANAFALLRDVASVQQMNVLLAKDPAPEVRQAAAKALGQVDRWDGVKQLVAALDDGDPAVRAAALRSIEKIMGMRFEFNPMGPRHQRQATMARIRALMPDVQKVFEQAKQQQRSSR